MLLFLLFLVGLGITMGRWAESKGYEFSNWFLASSFLGFIWLAFLPNTKNEKYSAEEAEKLVKKGNVTGIVLSIIAVLSVLVQVFYMQNTGR